MVPFSRAGTSSTLNFYTNQTVAAVEEAEGLQSLEQNAFVKKSTKPKVSIIMPVYNGESSISLALEKLVRIIQPVYPQYEIIVVDDGSSDDTAAIIAREQKKFDPHIRVISYKPNRGKGFAIRQGIMRSTGNTVLYMDSDLDISIDTIEDFIGEVENNDIVIASKAHALSVVKRPALRKYLSNLFNLFVRIVVGVHIRDTQSGLKAGKGELLRSIFKAMLVDRYAFDVELLAIAFNLNLKIKEMPVIMEIDKGFKLHDIMRMLSDILIISYRFRMEPYYKNLISLHRKIHSLDNTFSIPAVKVQPRRI
jgi:glycosyltransferase involved in cell wall biosynthesis